MMWQGANLQVGSFEKDMKQEEDTEKGCKSYKRTQILKETRDN